MSIYRQDLEEGHVKVLGELITATSTEPGFAARGDRSHSAMDRTHRGHAEASDHGAPPEAAVPVHSAAVAIVALYIGLELLTHLSEDDDEAEALFTTAVSAAGPSARASKCSRGRRRADAR